MAITTTCPRASIMEATPIRRRHNLDTPTTSHILYPSLANTATTASASAHPGAPIHVEHTDDASMKSSGILRRRCFNCCTTETATWRRSKLSARALISLFFTFGKHRPQLCNKCGIFERTHSRAPVPSSCPTSTTESRSSRRLPPRLSRHMNPTN
ncbi:hypothetical protein C8R43DRAFT_640295 [Mycena crocata]|nr:hypothetical protein C8R43DRAFT_640295 [Mycena crocata]